MRFSHSCLEIWSHKACLASEKMRERKKVNNSLERGNLENSTIRKCLKVILMSKLSFYLYAKVKWTLNIIEEVFRRLLHQEIWKNAISYDCAKWKMHQHQFRLLEAFRMTVWNFRMVMRNQLLDFPLSCSQNCLLVHFAWSREMKIHNFSTPFAISSISFS